MCVLPFRQGMVHHRRITPLRAIGLTAEAHLAFPSTLCPVLPSADIYFTAFVRCQEPGFAALFSLFPFRSRGWPQIRIVAFFPVQFRSGVSTPGGLVTPALRKRSIPWTRDLTRNQPVKPSMTHGLARTGSSLLVRWKPWALCSNASSEDPLSLSLCQINPRCKKNR